MVNPENFVFNTDYPIDKLVFGGTTQITVTGNTQGFGFIPNPLPFAPLMDGSWSDTPNYAILYGLNSGKFSATPTASIFDMNLRIHADKQYIYFLTDNYTPVTVVFYIRFYGFVPSNDMTSLNANFVLPEPFTINSDENYTKLYMHNYWDQGAVGSSDVRKLIPHNLGKDTQVKAWREEPSGLVVPITYVDAGDFQAEATSVSVDKDYLILDFAAFSDPCRVHYRLYIDE